MWYWDGNGDWTINVSVEDVNHAFVENASTNFSLGLTTAMVMAPSSLTWGTLSLTSSNELSTNDPLVINNTANKDITAGNVQITAQNLQGETTTSEYLLAGNFTFHTADACNVGTFMVDNVATAISGATVTAGNNTAGQGQEQLYSCIEDITTGISQQVYSTSGGGSSAWIVAVS